MRKWDQEEQEINRETKKGYFERFLNVFGIESVMEDVAQVTESGYEEPRRKEPKERGKVVSLTKSNKTEKVILLEPNGFDEVQTIVDHLRSKRAVIVNLEETEKGTARRIIDFLDGAIYAMDGTVQKINGWIFLFTPAHIDVELPFRNELKEKERGNSPPAFNSNFFRNDRER